MPRTGRAAIIGPGRPSYFEATGSPRAVWGFLPAPLSLTGSGADVRARRARQSRPRVTWGPLAAPAVYYGAAVGAPLGEWRGRALPGSPSRAAGWAALAPPGWASWDTGRQLATQGGDPWSPRAPRLRGKRARHYGPGEPHWKPRLGRARGENRAAPAE